MATLKKYSLDGKEIGEVKVDPSLAKAEVNSQLVKDYIVALRENARQWSASTKTRAEVKHTTKKPFKQKGTGRARQGMTVTPQYRGGGIVFGPKPKFDQHVRINKKERRAAIRSLIGEKIRDGRVKIVETTEMKAPKTQTVATFIKACEIDGRVLFLGEGEKTDVKVDGKKQMVSTRCQKHKSFSLSVRNLPKVNFSLAANISGYDLMLARELVMTEAALKELKEWLK